jgi:hypothetical protein
MELRQRYLGAVFGLSQNDAGPASVTPTMLAVAAVAVLPVDAAGVSLIQPQLRVPLGWTSPAAATAERSQTTLGDGPCLEAAAAATPLVADQHLIRQRWPMYYQEIERRTPFRSIAALPLRLNGHHAFGALDLYAERPDLSTVLPLPEVAAAIATPAASMLTGLLDSLDDDLPNWLDDEPALQRIDVWTAVGMLRARTDLNETDALARLRSFAYGHDLTLDALAAQLTERRRPIDTILSSE